MQRKRSCLDLLRPLDGVEIIFSYFYSHSFCSGLLVYVKHHINEETNLSYVLMEMMYSKISVYCGTK